MRVDVFTVFPELVDGFCAESLLGKARCRGILDLRCHDLREHTTDVHRTVDDSPFGGGAGMLLRPEPIFASVEAADPPRPLFLLGPGGRRFDQQLAGELAAGAGFSLLCGRYEGVDHRVREHLVDDELSVGDVVLAGGEVAACLVVEAVTRLLEGAMGNAESPVTESFGAAGLLEEPHFTRPAEFRGWQVPEVLRSRRSRPDRQVATGAGTPPNGAGEARPDRATRRADGCRAGLVGRVPCPPVSLSGPGHDRAHKIGRR